MMQGGGDGAGTPEGSLLSCGWWCRGPGSSGLGPQSPSITWVCQSTLRLCEGAGRGGREESVSLGSPCSAVPIEGNCPFAPQTWGQNLSVPDWNLAPFFLSANSADCLCMRLGLEDRWEGDRQE